MGTKLTEHFTVEELTASPTARARGIANTPTPEHLANMKHVCEKILEPVRAKFGKPVQINSSYRSPALNKAVGGSATSQHVNGEAVDFEVPGISNKIVADWVSENLEFDQVILEFYVEGDLNSGWVHASLKRSGANRRQKLIARKDGKSTKYVPTNDFDPTNAYTKLVNAGLVAEAPAAAPVAAPAAAPVAAPVAAATAGILATDSAIVALQKKCGTTPDGAWGPGTLKAAMNFYNMTPVRAAHFFAQTAHESGNFKAFSENLNYGAKGLRGIFGKYFPTDALASQYERKPEKIANKVYGGRMGNGPEASGDGWKFRGRGALQLTGKDNYQAFSTYLGKPEIMTNPDLVANMYAFESAVFFFEKNKLWAICDQGVNEAAILALTKRINGGTHGLDDRREKTKKYAGVLGV
jgi:putative chitinase